MALFAKLVMAIASGPAGRYAATILVGSGTRLFGLGSQFLVLLILSRTMGKASFGDMMTAFGFYRLVGLGIGAGPSLLLLYHISRRPHDRAYEIRKHRFTALIGAAISGAIALGGFLAAGPIADLFGKPGLEFWLRAMAPLAVISTLLVTAAGALEGRSRITTSILLGEALPNGLRILLLPAIFLFGLPEIWVAHVFTLSVLLPWLWTARDLVSPQVKGMTGWTRWDMTYVAKFGVATIFANQLGAADLIVAGALFSSEQVAEYAVAARIAALFSFLQLALLKQFAPRAGLLIQNNDPESLARETQFCARLTVACGAATIAGLLLVSPFILPLFGNYAGAQYLLAWLAIPAFITSFYATSDRLLIIGGTANVALMLTSSSFAALAVLPFGLAPWLGVPAIPAAMIFSAILFNPLVAMRVRQNFAIPTIALRDLCAMVAGALALGAYALVPTWPMQLLACGVIGAIGAIYGLTALGLTRRAGTSALAVS